MIGCDIIYELIFRDSPAEEHPPKGWECSPVAQIRLISSFHRVKPGHRYLRSTAKVERGRHAVNLMDVVSLLENAFSAVAAVFAAEFYGMFFSLLATSIRPLCDHIMHDCHEGLARTRRQLASAYAVVLFIGISKERKKEMIELFTPAMERLMSKGINDL